MRILSYLGSLRFTNLLFPLLILELMVFSFFPVQTQWFRTLWFIFPLTLFLVNLSACTLLHAIKVRPWKHPRKAGPDLIHLALILLILLGILSGLLRREASFDLRVGDSLPLPVGAPLTLAGADFSTYEDGRPRSWTVDLVGEEGTERLEVNRPLKQGGLRIYLVGFETRPLLRIEDQTGVREEPLAAAIGPGESILQLEQNGEGDWTAELETAEGRVLLEPGVSWKNGKLQGIVLYHQVRLLLVSQPLRPWFWAVLLLLTAGMILWIWEKIYE